VFTAPAPELAGYVARYWAASWDYAEPYRQKIVPYPNVQLVFADTGATVVGVCGGHQVRVLEGRADVLGVAFRPGVFRPFLGAPVSTITDRVLPAARVFGAGLPTRRDVATVEEFLRTRLPEPDPRAEQAAAIVEAIAAGPDVTRVDALAEDFGISMRTLQRLFAEHVGIGPKWVIRRYRLHEVTERLAAGDVVDWAALAHELGYADQAHFTRDFRMIFGESPTWYSKRY
jgi:AraC-like DNA-binding protein